MNLHWNLQITALPLLLLGPLTTIACTCVSQSVAQQARFAQLIFSGRVVSAASDSDQTIYKIVPTKVWRGLQADTLVLKTGNSFSCSANLKVGQSYVVLSYSQQWIGLCDGAYAGAETTEISAQLDQLFTRRRYRKGAAKP